jgi:hypothetical protein
MARGAEEGALDVLLARKRGVREEIVGWWRSVPFNGGGGGMGAAPHDRSWGGDPVQHGGGSRPARARPWRQWAGGACTCGRHQNRGGGPAKWGPVTVPGGKVKRFKPFPNSNVQNVQIFPNVDRSKNNLPELQKLEIKYGFEILEKMNNFLHRNFFRFGRNFE